MRRNLLFGIVAVAFCLGLTSSAAAAVYQFDNSTTISITDNATTIGISDTRVAAPGVITDVQVRLHGLTHDYPSDLDVMVETPSGQFIYLMSDNCGSTPINDLSFEFGDDGDSEMGTVSTNCTASSEFKPSNEGPGDSWTTAPGAVPSTSFAALLGTNQTGSWKLHVADDVQDDAGSIDGWTVELTTTDPVATRIPSTGSYGIADVMTKQVGGLNRTIADLDVVLNNLSHSYPNDMNMVLASPSGTQVEFVSSNCGNYGVGNANYRFDEEAPVAFPDDGPCATTGVFAPAFFSGPDTNLAPGFPGPYARSLSAFDGQLANGDWKLLINDDGAGDFGYLEGFDLAITMRGAKTQKPSNPTLFFKKLGKKSIRATGRITLSGEPLSAIECAGPVNSTFQRKVVRKKGKRKITTYKNVVAAKSKITPAAGGKCGYDISAKLPKAYAGAKLRLLTNYLGGDFIAPFAGTTTEKIKKLKF